MIKINTDIDSSLKYLSYNQYHWNSFWKNALSIAPLIFIFRCLWYIQKKTLVGTVTHTEIKPWPRSYPSKTRDLRKQAKVQGKCSTPRYSLFSLMSSYHIYREIIGLIIVSKQAIVPYPPLEDLPKWSLDSCMISFLALSDKI